MEKTAATGKSSNGALLKFLVFSVFGVFFFFINVSIGGVSKVPLIHLIDNAKAPLIRSRISSAVLSGGETKSTVT